MAQIFSDDAPPPTQDHPGREPRSGGVLGYFKSRSFILMFVGIAATSLILFFLLNAGLNWYTNHGQRLEVGDYVGMSVLNASDAIEQAKFRTEITDSVFFVDQPPGKVLRQDPPAGAYVKEDRRIYLTVTKTIPDEVTLPGLAGTYDFDRYNRKLAMLDVTGKVRDREYSSRYQPNTILKVYYDGVEITETKLKSGFRVPKGAELEFTVTTKSGGLAELPELNCRTLEEAKLFLENYRLRLGRVESDDTVIDPARAYVYRQDPAYSAGARIPFEEEVTLYLTAEQPEECGSL